MNEQTNPEMPPDEEEQREAEASAQPSPRPSPLAGAESAPSALGEGGGEGEIAPSPSGEGGGEGDALDLTHVKRVLEAALLSTPEPLSVQQLRRLFGGQVHADNIRKVLDELKDEWT
jgi:hypothetical protein